MVRTYTWNPSTQSSPTILGNFAHEGDKPVTGSLPSTSTNLFRSQHFSGGSVYKGNYKNGQVTKMRSTGPNNDTSAVSSEGILPAESSHQHYPVEKPEPHAAWLQQFQRQPYPAYYPVALDFTAMVPSYCRWRPYLFPPQAISPTMFGQTTDLRPIDPWQLRPVQIGNKIYYEPVESNPQLCGGSVAPVLASSTASTSSAVIADSTLLQNPASAAQPVPIASSSVQGCGHQLTDPKAAHLQQPSTSKNTNSMDLPWARGNPQPKSGIRGTRSWQTATLMTQEDPPVDRGSYPSSTSSSTYRNPQYQTAASYLASDSSNQRYVSEQTAPPAQWGTRRTAVDSTEQYKRDLQQQIEQNRRRREEERRRELEIERKEMAKFDEYRRKVQQEMAEEERKEKEKILAAQRKAARIRALQEEAEANAAHREAAARARRHQDESAGTRRRRSSPTAESDCLEWWEKKKEHVSDDAARKSVQSPVIPALRNRNGAFAALPGHTAFEVPANNDTFSNVPSERSNRSRSSSRISHHSYHSSVTSGRNRSSDSVRQRHQRNSSTHQKCEQLVPNSSRGNNEYAPQTELEREAASSRASAMNVRNLGRMQHST